MLKILRLRGQSILSSLLKVAGLRMSRKALTNKPKKLWTYGIVAWLYSDDPHNCEISSKSKRLWKYRSVRKIPMIKELGRGKLFQATLKIILMSVGLSVSIPILKLHLFSVYLNVKPKSLASLQLHIITKDYICIYYIWHDLLQKLQYIQKIFYDSHRETLDSIFA